VKARPAVDRETVSTAAFSAASRPDGHVAALFPGQGSQVSSMRERVAEVAPQLLQRCLALVGEDPFARVGESTRFAQPAIFCASVASWIRFQRSLATGALDARWRPSVLAGHSLGEIAALVAAEAIDVDGGLELAVRRGELMALAGERDGDGGMVALLGADRAQCEELAREHGAYVANDNAPGQVVLAGPLSRQADLTSAARERGLRAIALDVAAAFHSPAMNDAVEPFAAALAQVEIDTPRLPVISCASGGEMLDVRAELAQAIVRPVRWRQTMLTLAQGGATKFVDLGPGKVLAGLVQRNLPAARGWQADSLISTEAGVEIVA
jgi:malonyl CoA-acyl carrier protein transacylase